MIFNLKMKEDIENKLNHISEKLNILEKDLIRMEKHLGIVLGVILFLVIIIFIGVIRLTEEFRPDIFNQWSSSFKIIAGLIAIYVIYKSYKFSHQLSKNEIKLYGENGEKVSSIRKIYIFIENYFQMSFYILIISIVIFLVFMYL